MAEPLGPKPLEIRSPEHWDWEKFKAQLIAAGRIETQLFPDLEQLPRSIALGPIANKALKCVAETRADSSKRERGGVIRLDPFGSRVLLPKDDRLIVGTEKDINFELRTYAIADKAGILQRGRQHPELLAIFERYKRGDIDEATAGREMLEIGKRDFIAKHLGIIHSHPDESAFSPLDLESFLSSKSIITVLGSNDDSVRLLVKTNSTPRLDRQANPVNWTEAARKKLDTLPPAQRTLKNLHQAHEGFMVSLASQWHCGYYRGDATTVKRFISKIQKPTS